MNALVHRFFPFHFSLPLLLILYFLPYLFLYPSVEYADFAAGIIIICALDTTHTHTHARLDIIRIRACLPNVHKRSFMNAHQKWLQSKHTITSHHITFILILWEARCGRQQKVNINIWRKYQVECVDFTRAHTHTHTCKSFALSLLATLTLPFFTAISYLSSQTFRILYKCIVLRKR